MRTTVHLIRHGDALPAIDDVTNAQDDYDAFGLSATGVAQAQALALRVASGRLRPAAVYTSKTPRAYQTATTLAASLNLDVVVDTRLGEMYLGELAPAATTGADRSRAIRARLEELAAIAARDGSWAAVPDAEPVVSVRARMTAAVDAAVARHRGSHVALVSHAGSINAYLAGVIGTARDFFFLAGNTSLSSIRFSDGGVSLIRLNDTAHLESLVQPANDAFARKL